MDNEPRKYTEEDWRRIVSEGNASEMSKRQWCAQIGVEEKQFYYWQRKFRDQEEANPIDDADSEGGTRFVEITPNAPSQVEHSIATPVPDVTPIAEVTTSVAEASDVAINKPELETPPATANEPEPETPPAVLTEPEAETLPAATTVPVTVPSTVTATTPVTVIPPATVTPPVATTAPATVTPAVQPQEEQSAHIGYVEPFQPEMMLQAGDVQLLIGHNISERAFRTVLTVLRYA